MKLQKIAHDDPEMEPFQEHVANVAGIAKQLGFAYWLFVKDAQPVGFVMVGKEPLQLFAPIGTPLAVFRIIDYKQAPELLAEFIAAAVEIAHDHDVDYASISIPDNETQLITQWKKTGFKELEHRLTMGRSLDTPIEDTGDLRFEQVSREELRKFLKTMKHAMNGSPDVLLNLALDSLLDIHDQFLDIWYQQELMYFAYKDSDLVGVLDITPKQGVLNNLGVDPQHRGKGYGRQIVLFGLHKLKELEHEKASLSVAANNTVALGLYESFGFQIEDRKRILIWRKGK
ncbi:MAG: GNAT family N-acetyltransferase [Candidatus Hermodarchaeota archaeon]